MSRVAQLYCLHPAVGGSGRGRKEGRRGEGEGGGGGRGGGNVDFIRGNLDHRGNVQTVLFPDTALYSGQCILRLKMCKT